jgi:hypothetical protein
MPLQSDGGIFLRPPMDVAPNVLVVVVAFPFRVVLVGPRGIVIMPPGVGAPNVFVVEVAPPVGMILAAPSQAWSSTSNSRDAIPCDRRSHPTNRDDSHAPNRAGSATTIPRAANSADRRSRPTSWDDSVGTRVILPPPSCGPPIMVIVEIAPPIRVMLANPIGMILVPPRRRVPDAFVIVAPPIRMMRGYPVRLQLPPPRRGIPLALPVIASPFRMIL